MRDKENKPKIGGNPHAEADADFTAADCAIETVNDDTAVKDIEGNASAADGQTSESDRPEILELGIDEAGFVICSPSVIGAERADGYDGLPDKVIETIAKLPKYSPLEEKINVITHAFGAIVGVIAALSLIIFSIKDFSVYNLIGSLFFGASLIYLYVNSTLYHNETDPLKRVTRQKLDHSSINVLIAGSNTFFLIAGMHSTIGYILCAVNWALSIVSIVLNTINVKKFRAPSMVIYILTGWMCIFIVNLLLEAIGTAFWALLAGGLSYTLGLIFYGIKKPYMHAVWHFFVLGGSLAHIAAAFMIIAA